MTRKTITRTGLAFGAAALAATSLALTGSAASSGPERNKETAALRALRLRSDGMNLLGAKAISAKYRTVARAVADGYAPTTMCVSSPGGAMGYHYVNPQLAADGIVEPTRPEILLYAPGPSGKAQLVGLEYWKADADESLRTSGDRPAMFGRSFDGPMEGHEPGTPIHYDLHVWLWKKNPRGLFAQFNPLVRCS